MKYKLIFGSGWHHTYLSGASEGGSGIISRDDIRHSYGNYCREFKDLFYAASKEKDGKLWERVSLINPWNFYDLSDEKITKIHDELASIGEPEVNGDMLEQMKRVFDGSGDDDVEGLIEYISNRNEEEPVPETEPDEDDEDLAPVELDVLDESQVKEIYWSYGYDRVRLKEGAESKHYADLNYHVIAKDGNDGKLVDVTIDNGAGIKFDLSGVVSNNEVVFERVFQGYVLI